MNNLRHYPKLVKEILTKAKKDIQPSFSEKDTKHRKKNLVVLDLTEWLVKVHDFKVAGKFGDKPMELNFPNYTQNIALTKKQANWIISHNIDILAAMLEQNPRDDPYKYEF